MSATALTILSFSPPTIFVGNLRERLAHGSGADAVPLTLPRIGFDQLVPDLARVRQEVAPVFAQSMPLPTTSPTVSFVQSHAPTPPRMPPDSRS
jgi:hypothetical protein